MTTQPTRTNKTTAKKRIFLLLGCVISVVTAAVLVSLYTSHTKKPQPITANQNTKGEVMPPTSQTNKNQTPAVSSGSNTAGQTANKSTKDTSPAPATELMTPTGDFVSNHHPNLSGSPAPNHITSVCTTNPGAQCSITFTKDGVTKSLAAQVTDAGGSTYWDWKLQDIGLSVGNWHITASATLGNQTKTIDDSLLLEVKQ